MVMEVKGKLSGAGRDAGPTGAHKTLRDRRELQEVEGHCGASTECRDSVVHSRPKLGPRDSLLHWKELPFTQYMTVHSLQNIPISIIPFHLHSNPRRKMKWIRL